MAWTTRRPVAIAVAGNPSTPSRALRHLVRCHSHPDVLNRIPHNPAADAAVLRLMVRHHAALHPISMLAIAQRQDCPEDIVTIICTRGAKGVDLAATHLAQCPQTTQERLVSLARHFPHEPGVVRGLAENPNTPLVILQGWLEDPNSSGDVLEALSHNVALTESQRTFASLQMLTMRSLRLR